MTTATKPRCELCGTPLTKTLTKTIRGGIQRRVLYCASCDLGILEGGFNKGVAETYYKEEYWKEHSPNLIKDTQSKELFSIYSKYQGGRLALLRPYFSKKKTLLELGCSAGMFLFHARKEVHKVVGVDYDASAAAYAARVCKCETYGTDIRNTPIKKASADIVCAFQTLEHVVDPVGFLKTAGEYLKPGGILAIEVPNLYDVLEALYDLPRYHEFYYHNEHLWYFSEKSLKKAMRKAGFEGTVHFVQDYNVLNHMHWADTDAPKVGGVRQLGPVELPLRKKYPAARKEILRQLEAFDASYKKTLMRHKLTSNILFIGKKIK